jgi:hypothetical protein
MVDHSTITIKGGNSSGHGTNIVQRPVENAYKRASGAVHAYPKKGFAKTALLAMTLDTVGDW